MIEYLSSFHVHMRMWTPVVGESLKAVIPFKLERAGKQQGCVYCSGNRTQYAIAIVPADLKT